MTRDDNGGTFSVFMKRFLSDGYAALMGGFKVRA